MAAFEEGITVYLETGLDEEYFTTHLNTVFDTFRGEELLDLHVLIFSDAEECALLAPKVPEEDQAQAVNICSRVDTSLATEINHRSYIFLRVDEPFIRHDAAAFRGLFVHELVHVFEQFTGAEDRITDLVRERMNEFVDEFRKCGVGEDTCTNLVQDIVDTTVYALKDVFANSELINRGFEEELQRYYFQSIAAGKTCPMPQFYGAEKDVEEVAEAIAFDISLVPAWLPFEASPSLEAVRVFEEIEQCYEANIPRVAKHVDALRDVYRETYGEYNTEAFIHAFLDQVILLTRNLLQEQLPEDTQP